MLLMSSVRNCDALKDGIFFDFLIFDKKTQKKQGTSIEKESSPAGSLCSIFSPSYCISSVSQRVRKCLKIRFIHTEPPLFCSHLCYITQTADRSRVSATVTGSVCEEGSFSSRLSDARCSAASGMLSAAGTRVTVGSGLAAMPTHCCFFLCSHQSPMIIHHVTVETGLWRAEQSDSA